MSQGALAARGVRQEPGQSRGADARTVHRSTAIAPTAAAGRVRPLGDRLYLRHEERSAGGAEERLPILHTGRGGRGAADGPVARCATRLCHAADVAPQIITELLEHS
jgi:hypothetical protein